MAYINDTAFDSGLSWIDTNGTRLDICSQEPVTYAEATATYTLGNDTVNTGAPAPGTIDGRKVVVPAVTAGSVTGTGSASHWALTDGSATLVATGSLTAPQTVTIGNSWSCDAIDIGFRDAT